MQFRFSIRDASYPPMGISLLVLKIKDPVYPFGIVRLHKVENGEHQEILNGYVQEEELPFFQNALIDFLNAVDNGVDLVQAGERFLHSKNSTFQMVEIKI